MCPGSWMASAIGPASPTSSSGSRWAPAAALRQTALELLRALHPRSRATLDRIIDDSTQAKRGKSKDAVAKRQAPTIDAYSRGHQYVCGILGFCDDGLPCALRRDVQQAHCAVLELPFRKTAELAAQLIRECTPPADVKVVVWCEAYSRCRTVLPSLSEAPWLRRFHPQEPPQPLQTGLAAQSRPRWATSLATAPHGAPVRQHATWACALPRW
jgi:hypothetical protein